LPELAALCLLRVAQEALRNVARHAQARQVTVTLRFEADAAVLQVADDGRGFTVPANLSDLARRSHYGLVSLAEQTTWAGGQFSIESQPGAGTVVTARAPLER
jgi:signal transduction histidine kinase